MLSPKEILDAIYDRSNLDRISADHDRYNIYNGKLREVIKAAISREFQLPETVRDLHNRIIPINITQKIINKLAGVYRTSPVRKPSDLNDKDQIRIEILQEELELNRKMKSANRYFKLFKHALLEPYVTDDGSPDLRILPSHTYTPLSDSEVDPAKPTMFVKHLQFGQDRAKDRHLVWTDEFQFLMNGKGEMIADPSNPDGINPYGEMPFVFIKESDDLLLPIMDDDLVSMQIAICLLLTDLAFATKFQSWGLIVLIGADGQNITFNPNSVLSLPKNADGTDPSIDVLQPKVDTQSLLDQVEMLLSMLLTTKSLSVGAVAGSLNANNAASGVAKILDQSESTEDRQDQVAYFACAERELFELMSEKMLPYWIKNGFLDPSYSELLFSPDFSLSIQFPDMKPMTSEKDKVDTEKAKLDNSLTSQRRALKSLNPDMSEEEIDQLIVEIQREKTIANQLALESAAALDELAASKVEDAANGESVSKQPAGDIGAEDPQITVGNELSGRQA